MNKFLRMSAVGIAALSMLGWSVANAAKEDTGYIDSKIGKKRAITNQGQVFKHVDKSEYDKTKSTRENLKNRANRQDINSFGHATKQGGVSTENKIRATHDKPEHSPIKDSLRKK